MSFKVLVMSPLHQTGSTVVSTLMVQALTYANKTAMLAYTDASSNLPRYLGVKSINDPTRSIMQVVRLIDSNALRDHEILDYSIEFSKHAYLMNFGDSSITEKDSAQIVKHVYTRVPTDVCVVDCSDDVDSPVAASLIDLADLVFLVINPSDKDFSRMKNWLQNSPIGKHRNLCVIINHYDEVTGPLRNLAKHIGMPANRVCKVHENAWIRKCCLTNSLHTIMPKIKGIDPRVANLSCDMTEITQCVTTSIMSVSKFALEGL